MENDICGVLWTSPQGNTYLFHIHCTAKAQAYDHASLYVWMREKIFYFLIIVQYLESLLVLCSMVLYTFIMLCNISTIHLHNYFHTVKQKFCAESAITTQPHVHHALITTVVLFSYDFDSINFLLYVNHTNIFSQNNVLKVHTHSSMCQNFMIFLFGLFLFSPFIKNKLLLVMVEHAYS